MLKLSSDVSGCKPLVVGVGGDVPLKKQLDIIWSRFDVNGRGLHSSTFQLNLSALYGIGGARRGCVARVQGVCRVCRVCRVFSCVRHGSS